MATPVSNSVSQTANPNINSLIQGSSWSLGNSTTITYSLHNIVPNSIWSPKEIDGARRAFDVWETVTNIDFVRVGSAPDNTPELSQADIAISLTGFTLSDLVDPATLALGIFPDPSFVNTVFLPVLSAPRDD